TLALGFMGAVGISLRVVLGATALALAGLSIAGVLTALVAVGYTMAPVTRVPLSYNYRSLTVRWITALITAGAFAVVVFLLTTMLAFVQGLSRLTEGSGQPGNVVALSDGATDEVMSNLPGGASVELLPQNVQQQILRTDDGKAYLGTKE